MIKSDFIPYTEEVSFQVIEVTKENTRSTHSITYIAPTGTRYTSMSLKFKNETDKDQIINFEDFYLLDDNNNKYRVFDVVQNMKLTFSTKKMIFELKAGEDKRYGLSFMPPFPKDQEVTRILVKNKVINLK